jgi:hypothetical protein
MLPLVVAAQGLMCRRMADGAVLSALCHSLYPCTTPALHAACWTLAGRAGGAVRQRAGDV